MATKTGIGTNGYWEIPANSNLGPALLAGDNVFLPTEGTSYTVGLSSATPTWGSLTNGQSNSLHLSSLRFSNVDS